MTGDDGIRFSLQRGRRPDQEAVEMADAHRLVSFSSIKGCIAEVKREKPKKRISFGRQSRLKKVAMLLSTTAYCAQACAIRSDAPCNLAVKPHEFICAEGRANALMSN